MSRIIKFRAWDTQKNKMYSAEELGQDELTINPDGRGFVNVSSSSQRLSQYMHHIHPLQFTGHLDKNGKEIYEGDIISTRIAGEKLLVSWNKTYASFCLDRKGWLYSHWFGESCNPEDCEVIGNVYENPELIVTEDAQSSIASV